MSDRTELALRARSWTRPTNWPGCATGSSSTRASTWTATRSARSPRTSPTGCGTYVGPPVGRAAHPLLGRERLVDRAGADRRPDRSAGRRGGRARSSWATRQVSTSSRHLWPPSAWRGEGRDEILVDATTFPTDGYIAESAARMTGCTLRPVTPAEVPAALGPRTAAVLLNHVDYRTGRLHDLPGADRRRARGGRATPSGTCATARARCRSGWTSTGWTWRSAARTST